MDKGNQEHIDAALGAIEATHDVVSLIDGLKTGLESAGWSPIAASHAATTVGNTLLMGSLMNGGQR